MAKKKATGLYQFGFVVNLIFAIIPITNIIFGIVGRVVKGKILLAVLNFFLCPIFYIVDLISIIVNKKLSWLI